MARATSSLPVPLSPSISTVSSVAATRSRRQPAVPGRARAYPGSPAWPGRPRTRPGRVLADKAYGSRANRAYLRRRGIRCTIPEKADQVRHRKAKGRHGGRPPAFDPEDYKARHAVECGIGRLSATAP